MATTEQMMAALRNAHDAGDEEGAQRIAQMIKTSQAQPVVEQAQAPAEQMPEPEQVTEEPAEKEIPTLASFGGDNEFLAFNAANLPEIGEMPEMGEWKKPSSWVSPTALKSSLAANITMDNKELGRMLEGIIPDATMVTAENEKGDPMYLMKTPSGVFQINKEGFSGQDIMKFLTLAAGGVEAQGIKNLLLKGGGKATLKKAVAEGAATEAAVQGVMETGQVLLGGDFNPEDVLIAAAGGAAGEAAMLGASKLKEPVKQFIKKRFSGKTVSEAEKQSYEELLRVVDKQDAIKLAKEAMPDRDLKALAEARGIDLNPDHYSTNTQFKQVMQSLKADNSNPSRAKEIAAIDQLSQNINRVMDDAGRAPDQVGLSETMKSTVMDGVEEMRVQARGIYSRINEKIGAETRITDKALAPVRELVNKKTRELAGPENLPDGFKDVYNKLLKSGNKPTYGLLDQIRKDIGASKRGVQNVFSSADQFTLESIEKALLDSQRGIAEAFDVGVDFDLARKLVAERKDIEKGLKEIYGKGLEKSVVLNSAGSGMLKGNATQYDKIIKNVPDEHKRAVASNTLNSALVPAGKVDVSSQNLGHFISNLDKLKTQKGAYNKLLKELPKGTAKELDNLQRIAKGINSARQFENRSNTAPALIEVMKGYGEKSGKGNLVKKLIGAEGAGMAATGIPGVGTFAGLAGGAFKAADKKGMGQKAYDTVNSAAFKNAIDTFNKTGNDTGLLKLLAKEGLIADMSMMGQDQINKIFSQDQQ